jgi:predicted nucleic acid-binding protein
MAIDTSVAIPAMLSWHESHDDATPLAAGGAIPAHAMLETYAVLTRLPAPHRLAVDIAGRLVTGWFPADRILVPPAGLATSIVDRLVAASIAGGASYDALVGLTADAHGLELLTLDGRAARTYDALGVAFRVIAPPAR